MYHRLVWLVALIVLLFVGSSNIASARIPYQSFMTKKEERVWDKMMIREIKIDVGGSNSRHARQGNAPNPGAK
ncbi:unnamed protein product [Arabidopsis lyrata]|uniref:Predicted protein n=1 Tax=Arabidopsis lyrata subsp. lyrata TaxID=81972 RepID=D7M8N2_ARALL|nr:predicted protein [Arabidopsis lyrata subsp. lyrata]CAH8273856.1 unnamed protein product [Arabidopsis lyrata]